MSSPSPNLPAVLRGAVELLAASEAGTAEEAAAAGQRLLEALNPGGGDFPGWFDLLRQSGHTDAAQTALWNVALGVAVLREAAEWEEAGTELREDGISLVSGGARLLRGLVDPGAAARLADLPADARPAGEPLPPGKTGGRVILPGWRAVTLFSNLDFAAPRRPDGDPLDEYVSRGGRRIPVHPGDWVPSDAGQPSVCASAKDPPPLAGTELADFLDFADRTCRGRGLIREDQNVHWCGGRTYGRCTCPTLRPTGVAPPPGWDEARALYRAAADVLAFVRPRYGRPLAPAERAELDALAVRGGLARAMEAPPAPPGCTPYGVLCVPATPSPDGAVTLVADESRSWESALELVRAEASGRLELLGRGFLATPSPRFWEAPTIPDELRTIPEGTPEPLASAYRTFLDAVAAAAELYSDPQGTPHGLRHSVDVLTGRARLSDPEDGIEPFAAAVWELHHRVAAARAAYAAAEGALLLGERADECAFRVGLDALRPFDDFAAVILGVPRPEGYLLHRPPPPAPDDPANRRRVDPDEALEALRRCPGFDPAALLGRAREQVLRAARACKVEDGRAEPPEENADRPRVKREEAEAKLITLLLRDKDAKTWSMRKLAREVGHSASTLSKTRTGRMHLAQQKGGKTELVRRLETPRRNSQRAASEDGDED